MTDAIESRANEIKSSILNARKNAKKANTRASRSVANARKRLTEAFKAVDGLDKAAGASIVSETLYHAVTDWDLRGEAITLAARWIALTDEGKIMSWADFTSRESVNRLPRTVAAGAIERVIVGDSERIKKERKKAISALASEIVSAIARLTGKPSDMGERKPGKQKLLAEIGFAFLQFAGGDFAFTMSTYVDLARLDKRNHKDQSDFEAMEEQLSRIADVVCTFKRAYPEAEEQG